MARSFRALATTTACPSAATTAIPTGCACPFHHHRSTRISRTKRSQHLARVYETISSRFHLGEWHRGVNEKPKTLDNLYQLLQHDQSNRWMLVLEAMIVVLFILDLIMIFSSGH